MLYRRWLNAAARGAPGALLGGPPTGGALLRRVGMGRVRMRAARRAGRCPAPLRGLRTGARRGHAHDL